jgi:hypothetical protein
VASRLLSCSTNIFIRCPALAQRTADNRAYRYVLLGPEGLWASMVNIDGRDIWRLQVVGDDHWPNWSEAEIDQLVRRGIGGDVAYEVLSWAPWSRRELVANTYRAGRGFLVGDAAHQFSPTGGYGMNTGIAEAVDLSWKLQAVLEGWGGDDLLDTYDAERRPVAVRTARQASENLAAMRSAPAAPMLLDVGPEADKARRTTGAVTQAAMQREWRSYGVHLGVIYKGSPIVLEDGPPRGDDDVANFVQRAEVGARAPHLWLDAERSTLDLFGRGFVLLEVGSGAAPSAAGLIDAAGAVGLPLTHSAIERTEEAAVYERRFYLVRPDGHIAWRGDHIPSDPRALIDRVRGASQAAVRADLGRERAGS